MKKIKILLLSLAVGCLSLFSLTQYQIVKAKGVTEAPKTSLQLSTSTFYYGQVSNGKPHGKGTMTWESTRTYTGEWKNGKRQGEGTYTGNYTREDEAYHVFYEGQWDNNQITGKGIRTTIASTFEEGITANTIESGTFKNGELIEGYTVSNMLADPPYKFTYKGAENTYIEIIDSNEGLASSWGKGELFAVKYVKGKLVKSYSSFPSGDDKIDAQNEQTLIYLRSIEKEILPHLKKFEALSKLIPLK